MPKSPTQCYKILISLVEGVTKRQNWKDSEAKESPTKWKRVQNHKQVKTRQIKV